MKLLLLFDFPFPPPKDGNYARAMDKADWKPLARALGALRSLGHQVEPLALYHDLRPLLARLLEDPPQLVFNMADSFFNDRRFEAPLMRLVEKAGIRHSGCSPEALKLCNDKARVARRLRNAGLRTPKGQLLKAGSRLKLRLPVIVKPLNEEGSEGISAKSFCQTAKEALKRGSLLRRQGCLAYAEEYIEGREVYAGMLGGREMRILRLRETVFRRFKPGMPRFAHFSAKWDRKFRKKWGIRSEFAGPLPKRALREIARACAISWKRLGLSGCARLDLRVTEKGEAYVIEANPNPSLAPDDELARAAKGSGISYAGLLGRLVKAGVSGRR